MIARNIIQWAGLYFSFIALYYFCNTFGIVVSEYFAIAIENATGKRISLEILYYSFVAISLLIYTLIFIFFLNITDRIFKAKNRIDRKL